VRDEALGLMRDSLYVTIGFGVIAFQKLQVQRRELEKSLDRQLDGPLAPVGQLLGRRCSG
jgi:hypothetical protein